MSRRMSASFLVSWALYGPLTTRWRTGFFEAEHKERGDVPHDAIETLPTPPLLPLLVRCANAPLLWLVVLQVAIHRADFKGAI